MDKVILLKDLQLSTYISLDLETTGLDSYRCGITEISAYRFENGEPVEEFTTLIDPERAIPKEISELTGITPDMVFGKPKISDVLSDLFEFIGNDPIVGQNIGFDISFLEQACRENGKSFPTYTIYDTLTLAKTFLFFLHRFNLTAISDHFGLETEGAHRASVDTLNTGYVFRELIYEAASTPLSIIQTICDVSSHVEFYNKSLYNNILQIALSNKEVNGLLKSEIEKPVCKHFYSHKCSENIESIPDETSEWFDESGKISQAWPSFEVRDSQVKLATDTYKTFLEESVLLAEAGTGLGKSLAYLSAGVLHSKKTDIPLVVSTYTKNLQEQLFTSDIPQLAHTLDVDMHAVIYKGRHNYICLSRLENVVSNSENLLKTRDCVEFLAIIVWSYYTHTGDISECHGFKLGYASRVWDLLKSEFGYCTTSRCKRFEGCYLNDVRKSLQKANIIIVNHFLLCSELLQEKSNLPEEFNYVIDEGHNLVAAARDQLISQITTHSFDDLFIFFSLNNKSYKKEIEHLLTIIPSAESHLLHLEKKSKSLRTDIKSFFDTYAQSKRTELSKSQYNEVKVRYIDPQSEFQESFPLPFDVLTDINNYMSEVEAFIFEVSKEKDRIDKIYFQELNVSLNRMQSSLNTFEQALAYKEDWVTWASLLKSAKVNRTSLNTGPRDVGKFLFENLFNRYAGGLICSATLTVEFAFDYIKDQLGLDNLNMEKEVKEKIYQSPFHYEDQVKLFAWQGNADVNSPAFIQKIGDQINEISSRVHRRMLVLCTSYNQTTGLRDYLRPKMNQDDRQLFTQSIGKNRKSLLQGYLKHKRSILIGTSSFWEGVDLPGDKVELLILMKIPFASPGDPIIQSQIDYYKIQGRNPFMEFQVPDATVRLKQGFGRLIRSLEDSGICMIVDPRVTRSRYGKVILDSLPVQAQRYEHSSRIISEAESFFGNS